MLRIFLKPSFVILNNLSYKGLGFRLKYLDFGFQFVDFIFSPTDSIAMVLRLISEALFTPLFEIGKVCLKIRFAPLFKPVFLCFEFFGLFFNEG